MRRSVRPLKKRKGGSGTGSDNMLDGDDWVECTECGAWRHFPRGAPPDAGFVCTEHGKVCGVLDTVERFMVDWASICDDEDGCTASTMVYRFHVENREFSVHELYWSIMSFGGMSKVCKMKDVANDLLHRKYNASVQPTPGKNFGLIRTQWDRWHLGKYKEKFGTRPIPDEYAVPSVKVSKGRESHGGGLTSPPFSPPAVGSAGGGGEAWAGRPMWGRSGVASPTTHGVDAGAMSSTVAPVAELTREEKLELAMRQCASYVKGPRKEDDEARKRVDLEFRARLDQTRFRGESLGEDRYGNKYWFFAGDFSRLWVEKSGGCGWGCYGTIGEVEGLLSRLERRGAKEIKLAEALDLVKGDVEGALKGGGGQAEGGKPTIAMAHGEVVTKAEGVLSAGGGSAPPKLDGKEAEVFYGARREVGGGGAMAKLARDVLVLEMAVAKLGGLKEAFKEGRERWVKAVAGCIDAVLMKDLVEELVNGVEGKHVAERWSMEDALGRGGEEGGVVSNALVGLVVYSFDGAVKWEAGGGGYGG